MMELRVTPVAKEEGVEVEIVEEEGRIVKDAGSIISIRDCFGRS